MSEQTPPRGLIEEARALHKSQSQTIDGHPRPAAEDEAISAAVNRILKTEDGQRMFAWLRQITVNTVLGAGNTDAELRYQEGMRGIVALIEKRNLHHEKTLKKRQKQT